MQNKKVILIIAVILLSVLKTAAIDLNRDIFSLLDLDKAGLEEVKSLLIKGQEREAAVALLTYFRTRPEIKYPGVYLQKVIISEEEQKWADEALEHKFFAHKGYQPSYWYGDDINWDYWPVKDNELRWQLHRLKWFVPLGKAFWLTRDKKYYHAWQDQYMDWIIKNPWLQNSGKGTAGEENFRFAWRPLEVSHRLEAQIEQLIYFIGDEEFSPEFLTQFLVNYHRHAVHILQNYSKQGNHLLFEAQRLYFASLFFHEFRDAPEWKKSAVGVLNREINTQVYHDGMQYELDLHYHLASINIFSKALKMAVLNNSNGDFPACYASKIKSMITVMYNLSYPDYTYPTFGDAKKGTRDEMLENYRDWLEIFPDDRVLLFMATEGRKGQRPGNLSRGFTDAGFFTFRNGWDGDATIMVLKAGPPAFWHNQPDNGTFELWISGRNFFPDAGSYVYAGDEEIMKWRNYFRQTSVHNTLTLDNCDITNMNSKTLLHQVTDRTEILVTENRSYENLGHRRSVFFVGRKFFVIVDEATGKATGDVALHFHTGEGNMMMDQNENSFRSTFNDGNDIFLRSFSPSGLKMEEEESWISYEYRKKFPRKSYSFSVKKLNENPVRFVTVIYPVEGRFNKPEISLKPEDVQFLGSRLALKLSVDGKRYNMHYSLENNKKSAN